MLAPKLLVEVWKVGGILSHPLAGRALPVEEALGALRPGAAIDMEALKRHLDEHVHERPARPRSVLVIEALPVTAVGKIFKPALRDLAIREKVRLEVEQACGPQASARVEVALDTQKRTRVDVTVERATPEQIATLEAALQPLPQSYRVRTPATPPPTS